MSYTPPNFLLAQETHFSIGALFVFAAVALGFPWWYGAILILAIDLLKELTFDAIVEHQPFLPDGLVDWLFYVMGTGTAFSILLIRAAL